MNQGRLGSTPAASPVGRFAPSPTGDLHFGSLLAALASYCDTKQRGGSWQLRIDDIDGPRSTPGSAESIQRTLDNHGFEWDGPILWQGSRLERYHEALDLLIDKKLIFACNCSRKTLPRGEVYPGHCRNHRVTHEPVADHALRMRMTGKIAFTDFIQGLQQFDLALDVGDSIVWRRDQLVSYALACAVDDADNVTHVVRGADLLEGTGAQLAIIKALDLRPPDYAHLAVAMDANGDKLSKHSHARAIDDSDPVKNLLQAWQALGQTEFHPDTLTEFWSHAIPQWQMHQVPPSPAVHRVNQSLPPSDHSLLICLLALFLVNSPFNQWWSALTLPWYAMFLPWLLIIILVALNQHRQHRKHDDGD